MIWSTLRLRSQQSLSSAAQAFIAILKYLRGYTHARGGQAKSGALALSPCATRMALPYHQRVPEGSVQHAVGGAPCPHSLTKAGCTRLHVCSNVFFGQGALEAVEMLQWCTLTRVYSIIGHNRAGFKRILYINSCNVAQSASTAYFFGVPKNTQLRIMQSNVLSLIIAWKNRNITSAITYISQKERAVAMLIDDNEASQFAFPKMKQTAVSFLCCKVHPS